MPLQSLKRKVYDALLELRFVTSQQEALERHLYCAFKVDFCPATDKT